MKKQIFDTGRRLLATMLALGTAYAPLGISPARAQIADDDVFLITSAAAPNVILLMDNSLSMRNIEWHPAFDPQAESYGCTFFDNEQVYPQSEVSYRTQFNGVSDYVEVAHDASHLLGNGTISLWFNTADNTQNGGLFSKDSSGFDTGGHLTIRVNSSKRIEVRLQSTTNSYFVTSSSAYSINVWHHVAFTWGSQGMKLYVDGVLESTNAYTGGTGTTSGGAGNFEPIAIGASAVTSGDGTVTPLIEFFEGQIDETALFDGALSLAQVQNLHAAGLPNYSIEANKLLGNDYCENSRILWDPEGDGTTLWDGRYLNWYFSDDADAYYGEIQTAIANVAGCTQAGGAKFFADKYRRTRLDVSKQVLMDLLCVAESKSVRFGLAQFRTTEDAADADPNGGYITADLGRSNPNHAAELEAAIKNSGFNDDDVEATPLAETLFQIYSFWMGRTLGGIPNGVDAATRFPAYHYGKDGNWTTNSNKWTEDPMLFECEKAFVVIVTDGLPSRDDFDVEATTNEATGFESFASLIGDYHDEGVDAVADLEVPGDADERSFYLDDIAKYMHDVDFRPDLEGDQVVDIYTIGLATDPATDAFLQRTADVGSGLFFHAKDGDQLVFALIATLNDIIEKAASFTASAVPSVRTVDGGDFYQSWFLPSGKSAFWEGHIRAWRIAANGDILDKNGNCALEDTDPGECNSGFFKPSAEFYWDASDEVPTPGARNLYTTQLASGTPTRVAFDEALAALDLGLQPFALPPDPAPNDAKYPIQGSTALNEEGLADEVVAFGRGCFFGTGVEDATLVATPAACLARPSRLGDIFHSNPLVVRRPRALTVEESYRNFQSAYSSRSRVIYAGTNAGFLEAIHAGDWQAGLTPPRYDAGTGAELFGFMPWSARLKIKDLPIDDPVGRNHYVDGSSQVADVWIHPTATTTTKNADGREWRTMLAGGLRRGGRQYYALDVTNPDGITGPGGTNLQYPGFQASGPAYGWEFPIEGDPGGHLPFMGETWAQPVITRVRVDVDGDGIPRERWVAVVTGGYDYNGDPNPPTVTGRLATYDSTATEGRSIFLLDMKTGQVLARKHLDSAATDAQTNMLFSFVSSPAVFDINSDGFADVIYVGNLGGQMYKWVVADLGGDPVNGSGVSDDVDQPNWPFKLFFQAPVEKISNTLYYQNFYFPPAGAMVNNKLWMAWGAGERRHLAYPGSAGNDENNRLYVVFDPDPLERGAGLATVTESDLVDATNSPVGVSIGADRGFFIKGQDGEKFVTNTVIFGGQVITSSFTPNASQDPCVAKGSGTAYVFDLVTGEGFFRDGSNQPNRRLDLGVGLPADPKVSVNLGGGGGGGGGGGPCGTGQGNRVYIEKSNSEVQSLEGCDIPTGGQLLYWRER